jgi:hypothetical protein
MAAVERAVLIGTFEVMEMAGTIYPLISTCVSVLIDCHGGSAPGTATAEVPDVFICLFPCLIRERA